jgi:type IV fimbrial biogenesis protein FimT
VHTSKNQQGVTLVELVVVIAIVAILLAFGTPALAEFAERNALKGAAENIVGVIGQAKGEAIKRDALVNVTFTKMGDGVCAGAIVGTATCDCTKEGDCPIASSAEVERDLKNVILTGDPSFGDDASFVIDPKTGALLDIADGGTVALETKRGYGVEIRVNAVARSTVCVPSDKKPMAGVESCK